MFVIAGLVQPHAPLSKDKRLDELDVHNTRRNTQYFKLVHSLYEKT